MKPKLCFLLSLTAVLLPACRRNEEYSSAYHPAAPTSNSQTVGINKSPERPLDKQEAAKIAIAEAKLKGRAVAIVKEVWFERGEWVVGLSFPPEEELRNYAVVKVSTNGNVTGYFHGK